MLEAGTEDEWLTRAREADDLMALKTLGQEAEGEGWDMRPLEVEGVTVAAPERETS